MLPNKMNDKCMTSINDICMYVDDVVYKVLFFLSEQNRMQAKWI